MAQRLTLAARLDSFRHALRGLGFVLRTQHNAWIHLAVTVAVLALGIGLSLSRIEWALIGCAIALVWIAESLNTAIERLADAALPDLHPLVRDAKDSAAGAVLIAALLATLLGLLTLGPRLLAALARWSG